MSIYTTYGLANIFISSVLENNTNSYQKAMERLSSGSKFTTIGDGPVEISKTAETKAKISATSQALSNVSLGSDLLSLAEGGQRTIIDNLERIRDLCMQAASETYSAESKDAILLEIRARLGQIDKTAESTKFGKINLLDGSGSNMSLQIGTSKSATMEIGQALINAHASQLGGDIRIDSSISGATWASTDVRTYMGKIDDAIKELTSTGAVIGSYHNRLGTTEGILESTKVSLISNKSIISDSDVAAESTNLVTNQILQQISASILAQANQVPSLALSLLS